MFSCSIHISSLQLCSAVRMIALHEVLDKYVVRKYPNNFFLKEGRWFMSINHFMIWRIPSSGKGTRDIHYALSFEIWRVRLGNSSRVRLDTLPKVSEKIQAMKESPREPLKWITSSVDGIQIGMWGTHTQLSSLMRIASCLLETQTSTEGQILMWRWYWPIFQKAWL